jgi:hypothetical protein
LDRALEPGLNRFCCLGIDQTEFGLQSVKSLSRLISTVDDFIPIHPLCFIIENIFPTGGHESLTVFLDRPIEQAISIFFWGFEYNAPGIQEGGKGRDEREEFVVGTKSF